MGVAALWLLIALVWAAQTTLGELLRGHQRPFGAAFHASIKAMLPWLPCTLAAIFASWRWPNRILLHVGLAVLMAFVAQMFVVLSFGFTTMQALVKSAALWAGIRMVPGLLIYGAVAGITHGVVYYRDARKRELQLVQARLQALNAQIRPHFLFNTLHTIGQLWRSGRNDEAEIVLDKLGDLFHRVNRTTNESEVPLSEEVDMVRDYLGIEQVRFGDRMRVEICAPDELGDLLVPPLILQPLVENAVKHGDPTEIKVRAALDAGVLVLSVSDNGAGIIESEPGTGLSNTRERLKQLYRDKQSLVINGATVTIRIPAHDH